MKLITEERRLKLLTQSIINKTNKEKKPHEDLHASIKEELIALVNEWHLVSRLNNTISAETKKLLEQLEGSIYLTFKNHQNDTDNRTGQEQDSE